MNINLTDELRRVTGILESIIDKGLLGRNSPEQMEACEATRAARLAIKRARTKPESTSHYQNSFHRS